MILKMSLRFIYLFIFSILNAEIKLVDWSDYSDCKNNSTYNDLTLCYKEKWLDGFEKKNWPYGNIMNYVIDKINKDDKSSNSNSAGSSNVNIDDTQIDTTENKSGGFSF